MKTREDFFFSREIYTRIIIIDLIIVKLFGVCPMVFPSRRKGFPSKFSVLVYDCYVGLLILLIVLFGTQQMVSKLRFEYKQWPKEKARL